MLFNSVATRVFCISGQGEVITTVEKTVEYHMVLVVEHIYKPVHYEFFVARVRQVFGRITCHLVDQLQEICLLFIR